MSARLERWLVILVAVHSLGVGSLLLFAPRWALDFAGWSTAPEALFFPRQVGVFHFVVAFGYLHEYVRYRGVTLLVVTKAMAFLFLVVMKLTGELAWAVLFSGVVDALMGLAVALLHRSTRRRAGLRSRAP